MSALDEAANLKARRRAELAAAEEARLAAIEAERQAEADRLDEGILRALHSAEAGWLYEFRAGEVFHWRGDRVVEITFALAGHRPISMHLRRTDVGRDWRLATNESREDPTPWIGVEMSNCRVTCPSLADALLVAEIEGWTPPVVVSDEAHAKAAEAWSLMFSHAMPARIALGFVEEVTDGNVPNAMTALLEQAVRAMPYRPKAWRSEMQGAADDIVQLLATGDWDAAARDRDVLATAVHLDRRSTELGTGTAPLIDCELWLNWLKSVERTIDLCRELHAAANPEVAST